MIFISYFTPNGRYPALARKLHASLDRFGLRSDLQPRPTFASWAEGCRHKSSFIRERLLHFRSPVVWMDIDTEVWQYPGLLFGDHDLAIYNWFADRDHHMTGQIPYAPAAPKLFCAGGVQKWGYTPAALELLETWIARFDTMSWEKGDDPLLDSAFNAFETPLKTLWLPKTYNRMDKMSPHWSRIPAADVIINHDYTDGRHWRAPADGK